MKTPKRYGRQAVGKTLRSFALDANIALWLEEQGIAAKCGASAFVNRHLAQLKSEAKPA